MRAGLAAIALAVIVGCAWAVASPPGTSPDDDYHLSSIWCAWGTERSGCTELARPAPPEPITASVPDLAILSGFCTAFKPDVSAQCVYLQADGTLARPDPETFPIRSDNEAYPPGYYAAMRLLVTGSAETSIVVMRVVTFLWCLALFGLAGLVSRRSDRWRFLLYSAVMSVPLGWFIFASTNPSAWAVAGAAATYPATVAALRAAGGGQRFWPASLLGGAAVLTAVISRSDSLYFCGLAVACALIVGLRWEARLMPRQGLALGPVGLALLLGLAAAASPASPLGTSASPVSLLGNVSNILTLYLGEFATLLGWMDTKMPSLVWGSIALAAGAILAMGIGGLRSRRALALGLVAAVGVVLPLLMLKASNASVGQLLQPRYLLPLVFLGVGLLAESEPGGRQDPNRQQALWLAALGAVAHALALHTLMRRYISGLDIGGLNLNASREWWWDVPIQPMTVWFVGSVTFTGLVVILALSASAPRTPQSSGALSAAT